MIIEEEYHEVNLDVVEVDGQHEGIEWFAMVEGNVCIDHSEYRLDESIILDFKERHADGEPFSRAYAEIRNKGLNDIQNIEIEIQKKEVGEIDFEHRDTLSFDIPIGYMLAIDMKGEHLRTEVVEI